MKGSEESKKKKKIIKKSLPEAAFQRVGQKIKALGGAGTPPLPPPTSHLNVCVQAATGSASAEPPGSPGGDARAEQSSGAQQPRVVTQPGGDTASG